MTNSINVPRELLERVLDYDGAVAIRQNARHELRTLLSTPAADAWVPVSERLPDVAREVILYTDFDGVCAGVLDSYDEWFAPCSEYKFIRVTHWMPLPASPAAHRAKGVV